MDQWEYTVLTYIFEGTYSYAKDIWDVKYPDGKSTLDIMSEMGLKGWELVSTEIIHKRYNGYGGHIPQLALFFKRKIG